MSNLSWLGIVRLGAAQTALGAIVVITTSTLNRVMKVELGLPAMLPGILVALHSALQISRPLWGHVSDVGGRRVPWIIAGMIVLAAGGMGAAYATWTMEANLVVGIVQAVLAYALIGIGVGAAGTSILAMLAARVEAQRKAAAASISFVMMIFGFVVTTATAGSYLDPFTFERLFWVTTTVSVSAVLFTALVLVGLDGPQADSDAQVSGWQEGLKPSFIETLTEVWSDHRARMFTIFVFVSMVAYNTQDLILEPFGGAVFGMTPGESTKLTSVQHSGALAGMLFVAFAASGLRVGSTKFWTVLGCLASCGALWGLAVIGHYFPHPETLRVMVGALGFVNGVFAVAAIGWMMGLASSGKESREGIRMGLWGGAQAIGFAIGAFVGTVGVDSVEFMSTSTALPYTLVFAVEGLAFVAASFIAALMPSVGVSARPIDMMAATFSPEDAPANGYGSPTIGRPSRV